MPTPTPILFDATTAHGARGGDNLTIQANDLVAGAAGYQCRFVRAADYDTFLASGGAEGQALSVNATVLDYRTAACATPAWGAAFPAALVRVLLVLDDGSVQPRVEAANFTFDFYEVWDGAVVSTQFGARGGDPVSIAAFGVDPSAPYEVTFDGSVDSLVLSISPASTTQLNFSTPAWGEAFVADNVSVTFRNTRSGAEVVALSFNLTYWFFPALEGVEVYPNPSLEGGVASGGENVSLAVFGLDPALEYTLRFYTADGTGFLEADTELPGSASELGFVTPAWGDTFAAQTATLELIADGVRTVAVVSGAPRSVTFEFYLVWTTASLTTRFGAAGGDAVTLVAPGLETDRPVGYYQCEFRSTTDASRRLATNATILSTIDLECDTPAWGAEYSAERVEFYVSTAGGSAAIVASDGGAERYDFFQVWSGVSAYPDGVDGGKAG
ncbi:MAG: hypothetical protein AAFS07_19205, partial [Pseudomonadota bacterium]